MKFATSMLCLGLVATPAAAQSVEEILAQYAEARGGKEKLESVRSLSAQGVAVMGGGMEAPFRYEWKHPNKFRFELTQQGRTEVSAYDGTTAWQIEPPGQPEPMSDFDLAMLNDAMDYPNSPLVNPQAKGHRVTLVGKEEIEGTEAYKLEVVKKNGSVEYSYLDAEYFVEILQIEKHVAPGSQSEFELEVTWGDYKEIDGVLFPYSWSQKPRGAPAGMTLVFEKLAINVALDDERFAMPQAGEAGD